MRALILTAIALAFAVTVLAASSRQIAAEVEATAPISPLFVGGHFIPPQP